MSSDERQAPPRLREAAGEIRWIRRLLFLLLWLSYGYFYQSAGHNEAARLDQARALVEDGVTWVDRYAYNSADLIQLERGGERHLYSGKAPGTTLVVALPLKLWSLALRPLLLPDWLHWHLVVYLTTVFTVSLISALSGVVAFDAAWRSTGDARASLWSVVAIWLGSIAFPFSTLVFGHQLAAALLMGSFAILLRLRLESDPFRRPGAAVGVAGLLAGLSVVTEYPTALLAGLLGLYFLYGLWRRGWPRRRKLALVGCFALGGLVAGAALAAYNLVVFGELYYVPYEAYLGGREAGMFPAHAKGLLGIHWPGIGRFLDVLAEITVQPQRGLLYLGVERGGVFATNPVLWMALPGVVLLFARRDRRPEAILVASSAACFLTFNACYGDSIVYWGGGASVGPRHLIPMLPFLALPIAAVARRLWWLFQPLLAVSVFYMLLATAIEPRVGYGFRNPPRDLYLPSYLAGRFALARSGLFDPSRHLLTEDSVAFNLGKVAELPGAWQLGPLMAWWLVAGSLLLRATGREAPRSARRPILRVRRDRLLPGPLRGRSAPGILVLTAFTAGVVIVPSAVEVRARPRAGQVGLTGRYYANPEWEGDPVRRRVDGRIDFDWLEGPGPLPPPFSIEWTGQLHVDRPGVYVFALESDDGSVLEIDGRVVVDNAGLHGVRMRRGSVRLSRGAHDLRLRYFNQLFGGMVRMQWEPPGGPVGPVPPEVLTPRDHEVLGPQ